MKTEKNKFSMPRGGPRGEKVNPKIMKNKLVENNEG
jgi:hypothetical protein